MKINYSAPMLDIEDKPIVENEKPVLLGTIVCNALLATYQDEPGLPGTDKVKRFRLAQDAIKCVEVDVSVEDVAIIKSLLAKGYAPLIVGRAYDIIEPPLAPKAAE